MCSIRILCINATSSFPVPKWHRSCFNWFWAQQPCLNCHLSISAFPFFPGARAAEEIRGAERTTAGSAQFELIFSQNGGIPGNSLWPFLGWWKRDTLLNGWPPTFGDEKVTHIESPGYSIFCNIKLQVFLGGLGPRGPEIPQIFRTLGFWPFESFWGWSGSNPRTENLGGFYKLLSPFPIIFTSKKFASPLEDILRTFEKPQNLRP